MWDWGPCVISFLALNSFQRLPTSPVKPHYSQRIFHKLHFGPGLSTPSPHHGDPNVNQGSGCWSANPTPQSKIQASQTAFAS